MSVCYDFQKWTMITFASVAVSLTIGLLLINFAHGLEYDKDFWCSILLKSKLGTEEFEPTIMTGNLTIEQQILLKEYCTTGDKIK
jgi:ABC-type phosphate transport system auxiliary subunit